MQKTSFGDAQDVNTSTSKAHVPAHNLITIPPSWPFACWSLDMIGPLIVAPGGFNHVLVAVDKFTKWIEYKPITKISVDKAVDFICDILYRFGFPHTIITDLGSNFTSQSFWEFCENACIDVKYVSVAHPRANGQVERINGLILDGLKKRVHGANTKKEASGSTSYHMLSGGCALSPVRQQDRSCFC